MEERLPGDSHGRQPDWGNPTVREDKGGFGKHGYGGIVGSVPVTGVGTLFQLVLN